jgi:hypothetical protein
VIGAGEAVMEAMRAERRGADMDGSRLEYAFSLRTESLQFFSIESIYILVSELMGGV